MNFFRGFPKLYFALVISDRPTDNFKFESDRDCKMFMVTGDVHHRDVIPRTVLRATVDKVINPPSTDTVIESEDGDVTITEKPVE